MRAFAVSYSKIFIMIAMLLYVASGFVAMAVHSSRGRERALLVQRILLVVFLANGFLTEFILASDARYFLLGLVSCVIFPALMLLFDRVYPRANLLLFNNIGMFCAVGVLMISRINYALALRQMLMMVAGMVFMFGVPLLQRWSDLLPKGKWLYAAVSILSLGAVLASGVMTNGAAITFQLAGVTFQPSEIVKIFFVLFLAAALCDDPGKNELIIASVLAFAQIGILVLSRDLGSAVIFFVVYLSLLLLSTGNVRLFASFLGAGALGAVICYFLFSHVRVRVSVFLDPFRYIDGSGYQIVQSLFAISFGGLTGAGLMQGMPGQIPFVQSDFIFSAICEEMGLIVGICVVVLCVQTFLSMLLLAESYSRSFYQLTAFGLAISYIFQTFLTIGGGTKFIPLTGVTLPLVSYGGSSMLSTLLMFSIVETVFLLQDEREQKFARRFAAEHGGEQEIGERGVSDFDRLFARRFAYEQQDPDSEDSRYQRGQQ